MRVKSYFLGLWLILSAGAWAQPYGGTVYGVYPEGVMIDQGGYSYLIPTQHATFQIGGMQATWSSLLPGQAVTALIPQTYLPGVVRIPDPYAWKVKHHPDHPHGGPPGQMKKSNGNGKNKGKGK